MNFRVIDEHTVGISLDETTTEQDLADILAGLQRRQRACGFQPGRTWPRQADAEYAAHCRAARASFPDAPGLQPLPLARPRCCATSSGWKSRDLSLTTSMIPLGSCTMKLNAAAEMFPITWPEFSRLHPFAPLRQTRGYQTLFQQLEDWLAEITGFAGISLPAQCRLAGRIHRPARHSRLARQPRRGTPQHLPHPHLRARHQSRQRRHGRTESRRRRLRQGRQHRRRRPARQGRGAQGKTWRPDGDLSLHARRVRGEPSGRFAKSSTPTAGQVYMDGANLNAQVGLCRPADIGADVCHLNLHKTFCIPHGGGGPGMGPIGVAEHLVEFLPGHAVSRGRRTSAMRRRRSAAPLSAAPVGQREHSADFLGLHRRDGRRRPDRGDPISPFSTRTTSPSGWRTISRRSTAATATSSRTSASSTCASSRASPSRTWPSG